MSGVSEYRKRAVEKIEMLSENKLKVALDFIEYLAEKEDFCIETQQKPTKSSMIKPWQE